MSQGVQHSTVEVGLEEKVGMETSSEDLQGDEGQVPEDATPETKEGKDKEEEEEEAEEIFQDAVKDAVYDAVGNACGWLISKLLYWITIAFALLFQENYHTDLQYGTTTPAALCLAMLVFLRMLFYGLTTLYLWLYNRIEARGPSACA